MSNTSSQDSQRREKHLPYSFIRFAYDGTIKSESSIVGAGEEIAAWAPSCLGYVTSGATSNVDCYYHYTNLNNFRSIVDSGDLWVSEYAAMNDYAEYSFAIDTLRQMVIARLDHRTYNSRIWDAIEEELSSDYQCFILSLTENPISLGMYREYARPTGVAIGFPKTLFFGGLDTRWSIGNVRYRTVEHIALLKNTATCLVEAMDKSSDIDIIRNEVKKLKEDFHKIAPFIKGSGFAEEKEVRLWTFGDKMKIYERTRKGKDFKFIKLSWLNMLVQSEKAEVAFQDIYISPTKSPIERMIEISRILGERERKFKFIRQTTITENSE